jgi:hypoxanthine phosphoribosyltransferase
METRGQTPHFLAYAERMHFYEGEIDVMIDEGTVQSKVRELGAQITRDYVGRELTLVGVLKGSIFFLTDLARAIDLPVRIELMGVSSYLDGSETTGEVRITNDVTTPMGGRHLLLVEDIVDTGLTLQFLLDNLKARQPASLKVCVLLEKPARTKCKVTIDYRGFVIEDRFVVGYGLDHAEKYRNLPFVGGIRPEI